MSREPTAWVQVGVRAPASIAGKVTYALDQLLTAAGIPHRIDHTEAATGWDLFYGEGPPADDALWMAASPEAWHFYERPGNRINRASTARVAGEELRLPDYGLYAGPSVIQNPKSIIQNPVPDLALAAFFFLSRWEEWRAPERDLFGRYPLGASVFGRGLWSLTECPVEQYAQALRRALRLRIWDCPDNPQSTIRNPQFVVGLSHDIDSVRRWDGRGFARTAYAAARALGRAQVSAAVRAGGELVTGLRARAGGGDPHWNLEAIVALEQAAGAGATFFLLPRHTHRWDGTHPRYYQQRLPALAQALAPAAEVGVHASTAAAGGTGRTGSGDQGNLQLKIDNCKFSIDGGRPVSPTPCQSLREERERMEELVGARVRGVRFHNLRGGYDLLPEVAAAGFEYDSTLAFAEEPGFRAGIARPFRPYDRERDRPLDLVEVPLAVMDTTLMSSRYLALPAAAGRDRALAALAAVRRFGGAAALLWHNDNLPPNEAGGYADLYSDLLSWVQEAGGRACPLGEIVDDWKRHAAALQGCEARDA